MKMAFIHDTGAKPYPALKLRFCEYIYFDRRFEAVFSADTEICNRSISIDLAACHYV